MSRDPGSTWAPIPETGTQGVGAKTQFIVHSTGSRASAAANRAYFARPDVVVESTFIVGLGPDDPTLQLFDSSEVVDANVKANTRAIAVEVVGTGDDAFTDWQLAELARLGRWARTQHPIAAQVIPSEPVSGFGWHVMFGAPGPWTTVVGKVCPGAARVQQLVNHVFPAIFATTSVTKEEADLLPNESAALASIDAKTASTNSAVGDLVVGVLDPTGGLRKQVEVLTGKVDALAVAGVDYDKLADKVADRLAARLAG